MSKVNIVYVNEQGLPGPAPTVVWEDDVLIVNGEESPPLMGPPPAITWQGTNIVVDGVPGPDLEGETGPAPVVTWNGTRIVVDGVLGPDLEGETGPAPVITWQGTNIVVDGTVGPDLEGEVGPPPTVSWTGDRLTVGGVQGPPLTGPTPVITWDDTTIVVDGVDGPDLKGDPGLTTRYPTLSVSSPVRITLGEKPVRAVISYPMTITRWRLVSDVNTSTTVRIFKNLGNLPPGDETPGSEITGATLPTLLNKKEATGTTLTNWNTSLLAGDVIYFSVVTNSLAKYLSLVLEG